MQVIIGSTCSDILPQVLSAMNLPLLLINRSVILGMCRIAHNFTCTDLLWLGFILIVNIMFSSIVVGVCSMYQIVWSFN